jgi:hypothetical protein
MGTGGGLKDGLMGPGVYRPAGIQPDSDVPYRSGIRAGHGEDNTDARCHLEMFGYGSAVSRTVAAVETQS